MCSSDLDSPVTFLSYDPERNTWTKHPLPPGAGALVATDSALVQIGDSDEREPAVDAAFDPKTNAWQRLPDDPLGPSFARSAVWVDHSLVLAAGDLVDNPGSKAPVLVRIARLDQNLKRWTKLPAGQILGNALVGVADRAVWADDGSADGRNNQVARPSSPRAAQASAVRSSPRRCRLPGGESGTRS